MIITTDDAIEKVKSSAIGYISSIYSAALDHFPFTYQGIRNVKYTTRCADKAKPVKQKI